MLAERMSALDVETTFTYLSRARKLAEQGVHVVDLSVGQTDYPIPEPSAEAIKRAVDEGFTKYTEAAGIAELRSAIARFINERYGAGVERDEVLVTAGAKAALFLAMAALLRPGDEVLLIDPAYYSYYTVARFFGAKPVFVELEWKPGECYDLNAKRIEEAISDRTRMIVLNNPHNPTGAVFNPHELRRVLDIASSRGIFVVADEVYDAFVYDAPWYSCIEDPEWRRFVIYVNAFSKTFSMTGLRVGYVAAARELITAFRKLAVNIYTCAPSISQKAALAALRYASEYVAEMVEEYRARRDLTYKMLREVPGVEAYAPRGAFYVFPRVEKLCEAIGGCSRELTLKLIEEAHVAVVPGTVFPEKLGLYAIRISFAVNRDELTEGLERIKEFAEKVLG